MANFTAIKNRYIAYYTVVLSAISLMNDQYNIITSLEIVLLNSILLIEK